MVRWRARAAAPDRAAGRASRGIPMRRAIFLAGAALALTSTLALGAPESLLPGQYDDPAPAPAAGSSDVVQPLPGAGPAAAAPLGPVALPANFPSLAELEAMEADEIDE